MKQLLALVAVAVIGLLAWLLKSSGDTAIIEAKNAQIAALHDAAQSKDKLLTLTGSQVSDRDATVKMLQDKIKSDEDLLAKNQAQLDADKVAYLKQQNADQTLINSLKGDHDADVQALKSQIQDRDNEIAQLNEKLVQVIAEYETKLNSVGAGMTSAEDDTEKIYPKDNGFDAQDMGTGFFSYQVLGTIKNPDNVPFPPPVPNQTPWKFGDGNSGIAANGSGFYLTGATNGDSDGKKSTNGQAAALEYAGSWVSQTIKLPAGTFAVSFDYEGRRDYMPANIIAVLVDGKEVFRAAPDTCDHFEHVTTGTISFTRAGNRELKFLACGSKDNASAFPTTFIDNVCIDIVGSHKHPAKPVGTDKAVYQSDALGATVGNLP